MRVDTPPSWGTGTSLYQTKTQDFSWQNQLSTGYGVGIAGLSYTKQKLNSDTYDKTQRTTKSAWLGYNLDKNRHHLQLNGRFDDVSDVGKYTTGAINYGFDVTPHGVCLRDTATAFTAPSFNYLYYPYSGNSDLKAEKATYVQSGRAIRTKDYGARVTYFETRFRTRLYRMPARTGFRNNVDRAKAQGVELHGGTTTLVECRCWLTYQKSMTVKPVNGCASQKYWRT